LFVELFVVDILEIFVVISAQWLWGILVRRSSSRLWESAVAFTPEGSPSRKARIVAVDRGGSMLPSGQRAPLRHLSTKELRQIAPQATLLIHGENAVPKDLADFCKEPYSLGFTFDEGELLRLSLRELQLIETFCDSLLTALNISLMERAKPSLRDEAAKRFESHKK
jgi:hypothetical protein